MSDSRNKKRKTRFIQRNLTAANGRLITDNDRYLSASVLVGKKVIRDLPGYFVLTIANNLSEITRLMKIDAENLI